jgi:hypothetical protein
MSTITLSLKDDLYEYLRQYGEGHGLSVEAVLTQQAEMFRERNEKANLNGWEQFVGIIPPDIDVMADYRAHLDKKYQ